MSLSLSNAIHPTQIAAHVGGDWLSQEIDPYDDPWYRFSRILSVVEEGGKPAAGSAWLDVGCHQGQFLTVLVDRYGVRAAGVDVWAPELKGAAGWQYFQRNIETGFGLAQTFDFISALEVLEHMTDTDSFLAECRSHLQIGGRLVLSTPNINSLRNRVTVPFGAYPAGLEYRNVIHHVRLYNVPRLRSHLTEHGFEVISIQGVSLLPARYLKQELGRRISDRGARQLPQLCGNIIVVCRRAS